MSKLERQATVPRSESWTRRYLFGVVCIVIGVIAVGVTAWVHFGGDGAVTDTPDVRVTVPMLILAMAAGIGSVVRRERKLVLPILGVGLAAGATIIGWTLVLATIVAITIGVILMLSELM